MTTELKSPVEGGQRRTRKLSKLKSLEKGFVLNCVNTRETKLPQYNPASDKFLRLFFVRTHRSPTHKRTTTINKASHDRRHPTEQAKSTLYRNPNESVARYLSKEMFDSFLSRKMKQMSLTGNNSRQRH